MIMELVRLLLSITSIVYLVCLPFLLDCYGTINARYVIWTVPLLFIFGFMLLFMLKRKRGIKEQQWDDLVSASLFTIIWILGIYGLFIV